MMRKVFEVIGYTYEADVHCPDCARKRFTDPDHAEDREGNPVHPLFLGDVEEPEYCGDCGEELDS